MASDMFQFKCSVGSLLVEVEFCDFIEPQEMRVYFRGIDGKPIWIGNRNKRRIADQIIDGRIPLNYCGGWCFSGYNWNADDSHPYSKKDAYPWERDSRYRFNIIPHDKKGGD